MLEPQVLVESLRLILDEPQTGFNLERAQLLVELALERASATVSPVPDAARPIVLEIARRAWPNAQGVESEQVGPFNRRLREPGVYVTDSERAALAKMAAAAAAGAFTVRPAGHRPHHHRHR